MPYERTRPAMAFQRHEHWVDEKPPEFGLCRNFWASCAECGSRRVKAKGEFQDGGFLVLLACEQCKAFAAVQMRKPIPKQFKVRCVCKSAFVCPIADEDAGKFGFTCMDCLKQEEVRLG